jgi:peptidase S41-like protein/tricorn protease-like protein
MLVHDPEKNFEALWRTLHNRYPFFALRGVDWNKQYRTFRPNVTKETTDDELFQIFSQMLAPLNDGHVQLTIPAAGKRKRRFFCPEKTPRFWQEFTKTQIAQLFKVTEKTLTDNGFGPPGKTDAWMLRYCRSKAFGYIRILELENIGKRKLIGALEAIAGDFADLNGFIIDIRDCPGGEDSIAIAIVNRFCDRRRVAFRRKTKIGPGEDDFTPLKTWYVEPQGAARFTGPIVLLTCDSVFSGGEAFVLAMKELPHVTIVGDHTNGIFSYTLDKRLPNGWRYCLSYQVYLSADMICYEGKGVPADIELLNKRADIENGSDPLITRGLEVLRSKTAEAADDLGPHLRMI